jgi:hypothetical protein
MLDLNNTTLVTRLTYRAGGEEHLFKTWQEMWVGICGFHKELDPQALRDEFHRHPSLPKVMWLFWHAIRGKWKSFTVFGIRVSMIVDAASFLHAYSRDWMERHKATLRSLID